MKDVVSAVLDRLKLKNDPEEFVLVETREGKGHFAWVSYMFAGLRGPQIMYVNYMIATSRQLTSYDGGVYVNTSKG